MTEANCIFCNIVKKEIPAGLIYENNEFIALNDINQVSPTHILVIPKKHFKNLTEVEDTNLFGDLFQVIKEIAREKNLSKGFRTVINTGDNGGQTVNHLHVHILGGRFHSWPPG